MKSSIKLFLCFFIGLWSCAKHDQPMNIFFIAVDDLRPELGCYGVDYVKSPAIDKLASEGIVFNKAYCSVSWCAPSRTSMMTGLRPSTTGVLDLKTHFRQKIPNAITMSQFFGQQGYTVLGFGKIYHNHPEMQDDLSWTEPCWIPPGPAPIQAYATDENQKIALNTPGFKSTATEKVDVPDNAYPDGQLTEMALKALQDLQKSENPFFLAVGYYKPHLPFTAPSKYWDLYEKKDIPLTKNPAPIQNGSRYMFRSWSEPGSYFDIEEIEPYSDSLSRHLKHGYLACVSYIDAQIGILINELKRLDFYDNTTIVIWGDHGWKLGEYGRWSKHSNMEIDTRVPLIIKAPGEKPQIVDEIVETIDIYPTLVKLAGFKLQYELQGEYLLDKSRDFALSQIPRDSVTGTSIRTEEFRYTEWRSNKLPTTIVSKELYDHRENNYESVNIIDNPEHSKIVNQLKEKLIF